MNDLLYALFARAGIKLDKQLVTKPFVPSRGTSLNKEGLPKGYPGAKLARRAMQGGIAVRNHGLRLNGMTYKTVRV